MPRIAGIDIPINKRGEIALTSIYGIGRSRAVEILDKHGINPNEYPEKWTDEQTRSVRRTIEDPSLYFAIFLEPYFKGREELSPGPFFS